MAARKPSRANRKYETKYRIPNSREYERALRSRGDVTIWLSDEAMLGCHILNRMAELGRPESYAVMS